MTTKINNSAQSVFEEGYEKGRKEERQAWLTGHRCVICGAEIESNELADMCSKCFEEA